MQGIIIQARLGSTRLPKKMIKPFFDGKGIFELITTNIIKHFPEMKVIVATTTNPIDDELVELCEQNNIEYYRGSEDNVLQRFIETANKYNFDKVIRVCADNPFLNMKGLAELIKAAKQSDADYLSYQTSKEKPVILTHYGFWAEAVKTSALEKAASMTNDKLYIEHVTNYIYQHPALFDVEFIQIDNTIEKHPNVRMTLDTPEDFELLKEIYASMPNFEDTPSALVEQVAQNDGWLKKMEQQIELNEK